MAMNGYAIVISATDHVITAKKLYIGVAGTLKVTTKGGSVIAFANVVAGELDLEITKVWKVGTSATGIVALN
jgi:hypothetical protein